MSERNYSTKSSSSFVSPQSFHGESFLDERLIGGGGVEPPGSFEPGCDLCIADYIAWSQCHGLKRYPYNCYLLSPVIYIKRPGYLVLLQDRRRVIL